MKIIKENTDTLIFEEHPLFAQVNKIQINITLLIGYIYTLALTFLLEIDVLLVIVFGLITYIANYFIIKNTITVDNTYNIKVHVDKRDDKYRLKLGILYRHGCL
jgi:hypothetical protein